MTTLMTSLFFEHLRAEDRVSVKPHASPVLHAVNYLLGNLDESYLTTLRSFGGLQSYDGGIFVAASPDILYFKDTKGDGIADIRKVVFTGFGAGKGSSGGIAPIHFGDTADAVEKTENEEKLAPKAPPKAVIKKKPAKTAHAGAGSRKARR